MENSGDFSLQELVQQTAESAKSTEDTTIQDRQNKVNERREERNDVDTPGNDEGVAGNNFTQIQIEQDKNANKLEEDLIGFLSDKLEEPSSVGRKDTQTGETDSDDENGGNETDEYSLLDAIVDQGLLHIPEEERENFSEDDLDYYKELTKQKYKEDAINEMYNSYKDPYEQELFRYFVNYNEAGSVPEYKQQLDDLKHWQEMDISNSDNQSMILTELLKEGLDSNNPLHRHRLNNLQSEVDGILSSSDADTQVELAKKYIVEGKNKTRIAELERVEAQKQDQLLQQQQSIEIANQFHKQLDDNISKLEWNKAKKDDIYNNLYSNVVLQNGQEQPLWLAKQNIILERPELYIEYIKWLSDFDIEKRQFNNTVDKKAVQEEATKTIRRLTDTKLKRNTSTKVNGRKVSNRIDTSRIIKK